MRLTFGDVPEAERRNSLSDAADEEGMINPLIRRVRALVTEPANLISTVFVEPLFAVLAVVAVIRSVVHRFIVTGVAKVAFTPRMRRFW